MLKLKENKEGGIMLSINVKVNGEKYTYPHVGKQLSDLYKQITHEL